MADENAPDRLREPGAPTASTTPPVAEQQHSSNANSGLSESPASETGHSSEKPDQPVSVGARAIDRPTGTIDEAEGDAGAEDSLYDRLAKKDNTPVDDGGSSSLS